jgi:hypothetical protein
MAAAMPDLPWEKLSNITRVTPSNKGVGRLDTSLDQALRILRKLLILDYFSKMAWILHAHQEAVLLFRACFLFCWRSILNIQSKFAAAALVSLCAGAWAAPVALTRTTHTTVDVGTPGTFAGASFDYRNTITFDNGAGQYQINLTTVAAATGITLNGLGTTTVAPPTIPNGASTTTVTATSDGSAGSGYQFGYTGLASSTPGNSFISNTTAGGVYELYFSGGGSNALDVGGDFYSEVDILGDFSSAGSHGGLSYGAGYTLVNDFTFDGTYTKVTVETRSFNGTNPSIQFALYGNSLSVPEPGGLPLVGAALLSLFGLRRPSRTRSN